MTTGDKKQRTGTSPRVSVIMGVYNQRDADVLYGAVQSILTQTMRDFEFIIWDDGSDPQAAELLRGLPDLDPRIFVAGREENRGLAFSLNECIRLARGNYIARMDADDLSLPGRLEKQAAFLDAHPEYGWCGTAAELFDENGVWGYRPMPKEPSMRDYYRYSPFIHPSVMFRAELFDEQRGYLETEETLRCEDYEIFMNLTQRGLRGCNLQEALFRYRETRDSYRKRKVHFRVNEAKTRYRNFRRMGKLFPVGWLYVLRPILACAVPSVFIGGMKRAEGSVRKLMAERGASTPEAVQFDRGRGIQRTHSGLPELDPAQSGAFFGAERMPG